MSTSDPLRPAPTWSAPAVLVITAGGLGRLRPGPGTWASLATALLAAPLWLYTPCPAIWLAASTLSASLAAIVAWPHARHHFHRPDPSACVIDEVAGMGCGLTLTAWAAPGLHPLLGCLYVFAWFRLFDIAKPPPVSWGERLPGIWGIMCDDWLAGLCAGWLTVVWSSG